MRRLINRYSTALLMAPYAVLFCFFIVIPVMAAVGLSFTYFNTIESPSFTGLDNYITLLTNDSVFMQKVLPNTILYAIFVGAGVIYWRFSLAWSLSQISHKPRTILAILIYSPSMTGSVLISSVWGVIFSGDKNGYLNYWLMELKVITEPINWLQSGGVSAAMS